MRVKDGWLNRRSTAVRGALALLLALPLLWGAAPTASAAQIVPLTGTIRLSIQQSGQAATITASGTYAQFPSRLVVYVLPGGSYGPASCSKMSAGAAWVVLKVQRDMPAAAATIIQRDLSSATSGHGTYSVRTSWGKGAPAGVYLVCGYLLAPHIARGEPEDPPDATASARLTIGSTSNTVPKTGVQINAFSTVAASGHFNLSGTDPARVDTYRFGAKFVNIYFRVNGVAPNALHWTYDLSAPNATGAVGSGPAITTTIGKSSATVLDLIFTQNKRPFPAGRYRLSLVIGGTKVATTTFTIAP